MGAKVSVKTALSLSPGRIRIWVTRSHDKCNQRTVKFVNSKFVSETPSAAARWVERSGIIADFDKFFVVGTSATCSL